VAVLWFKVTFDASGSTDDRGIVDVLWDFGDTDPAIDILRTKLFVSGDDLFYYFALAHEVDGSRCACSFDVYLDSDGNAATGSPVYGLGAEFSVRVRFNSEGIATAYLTWYFRPQFPGDSLAWKPLYYLPFEFRGGEGEGALRRGDILARNLQDVRLVVVTTSNDSFFDVATFR